MPTVHIALSDEEYERLRRMAAHLGASTDAAARSLLRAALEQRELAPAERLLRAIEEVYRQHGTLKTSESTAIIREFRERDE